MEKLYKVKPLEWEKKTNCVYVANNPVGLYTIDEMGEHLFYTINSYMDGKTEYGDNVTLIQAQRACQSHYEERIKQSLEEVII